MTMSNGCEDARQLERRLRWQHRDTPVEEPDENDAKTTARMFIGEGEQ